MLRAVRRVGQPLDRQRERQQRQPAEQERPAGEARGTEARWVTPALGEHGGEAHHDHAGGHGQDAPAVQTGRRAQHQQADADDAEATGDDVDGPDLRVQQGNREDDHDQRGDRVDHRGDAAGQQVGGDEEQREERRAVHHRQQDEAPPPAARRPRPGGEHQHETGRQRPHQGGQQRSPRGQELGGEQVGGAEDHRADRGHVRPAGGGLAHRIRWLCRELETQVAQLPSRPGTR